MSLLRSAVPGSMTVPQRILLFGLAAVAGGLAGVGWSVDLTNWAYYGFLQGFLDPRAQIANLAVGVALAYLVGFIHVVSVCGFPAVLAALPLVQVARDKRDWLKTALVLMAGMVVVTALFGAIVGGAGGAFAGLGTSSRPMALVMRPVLITIGLLMVIVALGEFGLVRRLLPELHPAQDVGEASVNHMAGSPYRRAATLGVMLAATFGIICTRPTYLALLAYIAVVGSIGYGVLALAAYGVGLASPIALGGFGLLPAGRSTRLLAWLEARREAIHVVQGILLTFLGTLTVAFFWVRYIIPAA